MDRDDNFIREMFHKWTIYCHEHFIPALKKQFLKKVFIIILLMFDC